jgi:hypothetical protein
MGLPEPREFSSLSRLKLIQSGIERVYSQHIPLSTKVRLPITPAILLKVKEYWTPRASDPDIVMLWAAAVLCYFGFFRSGEITVPTLQSFDVRKHLSWGDVAIDNPQAPQTLRINLKQSKTDQFSSGVEVYVGRTGCALCPVAGVLAYMAIRETLPGPFFKFQNGCPLTKPVFTKKIRAALQAIGLPHLDFAGHSFRIGAATAAARAGIEDSTIRVMGRWNSSAFQTYIRTPRQQLAQFSALLSCP